MIHNRILMLICLLIIITTLTCSPPKPQEQFSLFLSNFFLDSVFQKSRVIFPFHVRQSFLDQNGNNVTKDTVFLKSSNQWEHIPSDAHEKGSKYDVYTDTLLASKNDTASIWRIVDFGKEETCLNLTLVFTVRDGKWFLIRYSYFEP
jgi:hypothetical protein